MTFAQVLNVLRNGGGYKFTHSALQGYFYKAPYPAQKKHSLRDHASSAITFWNDGKQASPTLMLYDFDRDANWTVELCDDPVMSEVEI